MVTTNLLKLRVIYGLMIVYTPFPLTNTVHIDSLMFSKIQISVKIYTTQ